ncbi:MAG: helix-turn-helix domain-containing protein [Treponema sp.]|nr:helix-turn-helix domain-containing protein [Treponema sp.]
MAKTNIIQRRDLEPLWAKATEMAHHYEKAANCIVSVIGADCVSVELSKHPKAVFFCSLCKRYCQSAGKLAPHDYPCSDMHREAVQKACKLGGSYTYKCPVGFIYWTSPFFAGERFAGAFITAGLPADEKQQLQDKIFDVCKGEVSRTEIAQYLEGLPEKRNEEMNALVQMLMLCAEKISCREPYQNDLSECGDRQNSSNCQPNLLDQERLLIASLRRGDSGEARNILRGLLNNLNAVCNNNLEHFKLKAIELVVLLSRVGSNSGVNEEFGEPNNRFFRRIEDAKTIDEVIENMYIIQEQMAGKIFSFQGIRHASSLRKAERFIWENYTRKVSLKEIADVSGLSAPYFSTIFKDEMGENLSNYINRLRVEKASLMLRETESPISGISTACGFEDQSWFSKIFKSYTGFSPCKYREHGGTVVEQDETQLQ